MTKRRIDPRLLDSQAGTLPHIPPDWLPQILSAFFWLDILTPDIKVNKLQTTQAKLR